MFLLKLNLARKADAESDDDDFFNQLDIPVDGDFFEKENFRSETKTMIEENGPESSVLDKWLKNLRNGTNSNEIWPRRVKSTADNLSASSSSAAASLDSKDYWVKKWLDMGAAKNAAEAHVDQLKQRNAEMELENMQIRESKVRMQVRVEQEEEYISNMLLKRIQKLKTDKEQLAQKYEQEEKYLINDLIRKLTQLRREKVDLENSLEHEQEALFNTLGKRMDSLEAEKRRLQGRLDELEGGGATVATTTTTVADEGRVPTNAA